MYREYKIEKENWVDYLDGFSFEHAINVMGEDWLDENKSIVLVTDSGDYRDTFSKDYYELFKPEFFGEIEEYNPSLEYHAFYCPHGS